MSPARWAGVALVIAAIVGAVMLAMLSPSEPAGPGQPVTAASDADGEAGPSPSASAIDDSVPLVAPEIVVPADGTSTREFEFAVTVALPDDVGVERGLLNLDVYNNGEHAKRAQKFKLGSEVRVQGVRLAPGENELTTVLSSPAGPGPTSAPVSVILDDQIPELEIISPQEKSQTYEDTVLVELSSEPDTNVTLRNKANTHDPEVPIGADGSASQVIRLKMGTNRIVAEAVDEAGQVHRDKIVVTRLDGRPTIKLKKVPKSVKPPAEIRIVAEVTGADKKPMKDATVDFTLTAPNQSTQYETGTTNAKGRAIWEVTISESSSPAAALELGLTVTSPSGDKGVLNHSIALQ